MARRRREKAKEKERRHKKEKIADETGMRADSLSQEAEPAWIKGMSPAWRHFYDTVKKAVDDQSSL